MNITISKEGSNPVTISTEGMIKDAGGISKANVASSVLTGVGAGILHGTIYNAATSIGSFNSGDEMLDSDKLKKALDKKILSNKKYQYPTVDEVKASSKAKNKSGFLAWLFGGQSAGTKVKSMVGSTAMKIKIVSGVPVSVVKLNPLMGSKDLTQLGGMRVLVATAFVKDSKGNIKSIPLCRGYLTKGNLVNASREAADIFFSEESETPITKKDIINYISMSRESSNPKLNDEMMFFLREATI
jgi:hypothetical protein